MKKVLIIDDKAEQIEKAVKAVRKQGWEPIICDVSSRRSDTYNNTDWINLISQADGVITDLMWGHREFGEMPMGLLVVIEALSKGKPVVICTNHMDYDRGHHGPAIGFINDGYRTASDKKAFGWEEEKNWSRATKELATRML